MWTRLGAVTVPASPLAHELGFRPLPADYFAALAAMVIGYLRLVEAGNRWFYRAAAAPAAGVPSDLGHRFLRRRDAPI